MLRTPRRVIFHSGKIHLKTGRAVAVKAPRLGPPPFPFRAATETAGLDSQSPDKKLLRRDKKLHGAKKAPRSLFGPVVEQEELYAGPVSRNSSALRHTTGGQIWQ